MGLPTLTPARYQDHRCFHVQQGGGSACLSNAGRSCSAGLLGQEPAWPAPTPWPATVPVEVGTRPPWLAGSWGSSTLSV